MLFNAATAAFCDVATRITLIADAVISVLHFFIAEYESISESISDRNVGGCFLYFVTDCSHSLSSAENLCSILFCAGWFDLLDNCSS